MESKAQGLVALQCISVLLLCWLCSRHSLYEDMQVVGISTRHVLGSVA